MLKKIIIIILIIAAASFLYWRQLDRAVDLTGQSKIFVVEKGQTIKQTAANLKKENLIRSAFYFEYVMWQRGADIKAGEYFLSPALTSQEIANLLHGGQVVNQENIIRIIEGWSIKDINKYLNDNKIIPENSFSALASQPIKNLKLAGKPAELLADAPKNANLEGYLFPDTYRVFKDVTAGQIMEKMLNNLAKKLTPDLRQEIKRQKKSVYEIITLASLIEKEVRTADDMKIVSGIFWNRLKNGLALNSCATLAYILGVNKPQYTLADTKINSLYNTYKYRGLPPGPIANPGLNAIKAAVYPEHTEYNYFLSDPVTGQTIYSKTLEEHNRNKAKYLK